MLALASLDETVTVSIAAEPVFPALRKLLGERSFVLQYAASAGCEQAACKGTLWVLADEMDSAQRAAVADDAASVAALSVALTDADANVRQDAAADLALLNDRTAEAALTAAALRDADPSVRAEALHALSTLPRDTVADARHAAFKLALVDVRSEVRKAAVAAVENLRTRETLGILSLALDDPDASVRAMAADSLVEIGGADHPALQRARTDESAAVREAARAYD